MSLSRFQEWSARRGPIRDAYWRWYVRRLKRWAARHDVPPAPPLDAILGRIDLSHSRIENGDRDDA